MLFMIIALTACKGDEMTVLKEKENEIKKEIEKSSIQGDLEESTVSSEEADSTQDKTIKGSELSESEEFSALRAIFSEKWVESYESPKLIAVETLNDKELFETIWYIDQEIDGSSLMFFEDGKYLLAVNRFGEDVIGDYEIIDNHTIQLSPKHSDGDVEASYPRYYEEMTLTLKRDIKNIYYSDTLVFEGSEEVFYSLFSPTEVGSECLIDGNEVIKTDKIYAAIINRTKLKEKPDVNANNAEIHFTYEVNDINNPYKMEEYYTPEELQLFEDLDEFLEGMAVVTLAHTKDKYLVGGMEDYWYYVSYHYFEGVWYEGWVYGACLEPFDETKVDDYINIFKEEIDSFQ